MLDRRPNWRCAPLSIREAARCATLHRTGFAKGWPVAEFERLLSNASVLADGAGQGGAISGFILSRRAADEAEILTVAVDPVVRKQGLASALLGFHLSRLGQAGVSTLFLEVDEANVAAQALYRRYGFRRVGERKGYYTLSDGRRATALVMRCEI
jgi:ribosomal-protein-alanine N-acetyltransferase